MGRSILYIDCFAGISGDMTVAALLELVGDSAVLERELAKLGLDGEFHLEHSRVVKGGIDAARFSVHLTGHPSDGEAAHHDPHHHHHHHHDHRAYRDIHSLIERAGLAGTAGARACSIFETIAVAEGKIHGVPTEEVRFHEVGAVDSIVDIVSIAVLIDLLAPDRIVGAPVPVGRGLVRTMHGLYPVPAPATLEILRGYPIQTSDTPAELTTPTGAAVLATLARDRGPLPSMEVSSVGYGAGHRDFDDHPNVLRLVFGSERETGGDS